MCGSSIAIPNDVFDELLTGLNANAWDLFDHDPIREALADNFIREMPAEPGYVENVIVWKHVPLRIYRTYKFPDDICYTDYAVEFIFDFSIDHPIVEKATGIFGTGLLCCPKEYGGRWALDQLSFVVGEVHLSADFDG